jgi:ribonuclease HI
MDLSAPHFLLSYQVDRSGTTGHWRFVFRGADGAERLRVADTEPGLLGERLELLTVVRALEALDQPTLVTLVDCSEYVWRGIHYGLPEWRTNAWRWEFFGQMVPVKNHDLWQRMDHALGFHRVECRRRRIYLAHPTPPGPMSMNRGNGGKWGLREKLSAGVRYVAGHLPAVGRRRAAAVYRTCRRWMIRSCRPRTAYPWTT